MAKSILPELEMLLITCQAAGVVIENTDLELLIPHGESIKIATFKEGFWHECEPAIVPSTTSASSQSTDIKSEYNFLQGFSPLWQLENLAPKYPALDRIFYESSWYGRRSKRAAPALNEFDKDQTPLHDIISDSTIALQEKKRIVGLLIKAGADVNIPDTNKRYTALHLAAKGNYLEIVQLLLDARANIAATAFLGMHKLPVQMIKPSNPIWALLMKQHGSIFMEEVERLTAQLASLTETEYSLPSIESSSVNSEEKFIDINLGPEPTQSTTNVTSSSTSTISETSLSLHEAVETDDIELAKQLLSFSTTDIEATRQWQSEEGVEYLETPLYAAVRRDNVSMVRLLLLHGASANSRYYGPAGCTPLHKAAGNSNKDIVQLLLLHGAKASIETDGYSTPDDLAWYTFQANPTRYPSLMEIWQLFQFKNYFLKPINKLRLDISLRQKQITLSQENHLLRQKVAMLSPLIASSSRQETDNSSLPTNTEILSSIDLEPAHVSYVSILENLIGDYPALDRIFYTSSWFQDRTKRQSPALNELHEGRTPLHDILIDSTIESHTKKYLVNLLIHAGAELNIAESEQKNTPLHLAAEHNETEIVELLINAGADISLLNKNRCLAVQLAKPDSHTWRLLLEAHGKIFVKKIKKLQAQLASAQESIKCSTQHATNPIEQRSMIPTSSSMAIEPVIEDDFSEKETDSDYDDNLEERDINDERSAASSIAGTTFHFFKKSPEELIKEKTTPLHYAVETNNLDAAKELLAQSINIEETADFRDALLTKKITALELAVEQNKVEMVKLLLKHGARMDHQNFHGRQTALHRACRWEMKEIIELLLLYGAKTSVRDHFPMGPMRLTYDPVLRYLGRHRDYFLRKIKALKQEISTLEQLAPLMKEQHTLQEQVRELEAAFASDSKEQPRSLRPTM
jgi:ankyrin repeat protein